MQISTLIGKPVLSPGGEAYGYITDVRLSRDFKKLSCIVIADAEEEEAFLPPHAIKSVSDAVIAGRARLASPAGIGSPIGKRVYSAEGKELGAVGDVYFGEAPCFLISNGNIADMVPASLVSVAETVIVYASEEERARCKKTAGAAKPSAARKAKAKREVPHRPGEEPAVDLPDVIPPLKEPSPTPPAADPPVPKGLALRTDLLGRYVKRPVYDNTGVAIAQTGDRVTPALIASARRAGKLLALAVNTLTQY